MRHRFSFTQIAFVVCLWCAQANSCTRADVVPDMNSLKHQIEQSDAETVLKLTESADARTFLSTIHPGAQFYLGLSLQEKGSPKDAAVLFRAQLGQKLSPWHGPAFRGWIACMVASSDWRAIVDDGPGLMPAFGADANTEVEHERNECRELLDRTYLDALMHLKDWNRAHDEIVRLHQSINHEATMQIGSSAVPRWLMYQTARLAVLQLNTWPQKLSDDFLAAVLPYVLSVEAAEGHGEIYWKLHELADNAKDNDRAGAALLQLLKAKDLLARGQASLAYDELKIFVQPLGKESSKQVQVAIRFQKGLLDLQDKAGLIPIGFIKDLYETARLAGRMTDGVILMDRFRKQVIDPRASWKNSAALPYLLELKGRLLRAKGDLKGTLDVFAEAVKRARVLESQQQFVATDRRRLQWYYLKAMMDSVEDLGKGNLWDVSAFIAVAKFTDEPEYFTDVFERALLQTAGRNKWDIVARLYSELKDRMEPLLQAKTALVLARAVQLKGLDTDARRAEFEAYSSQAREQSYSLYYRAVAAWMRGEPTDVASILQATPDREAFQQAGAVPGSLPSPTWSELIAAGFIQTGMYDEGMDWIWPHRMDLDIAGFTRIGRAYVEAGRYRQGLRILESVRIRGGHPVDPVVMAPFYPRPFANEMKASIDGTVVPEWLMFALTRTESNFDTSARSGPGARGLAQLMPATAKLVARGLKMEKMDLDDPAINLKLGATYLQDQFTVAGRWPQALAAYNAGMGRIRSWTRNGLSQDPILFTELVPFEETRNYVRRITESSLLYSWLYYRLEPSLVLSVLFKTN